MSLKGKNFTVKIDISPLSGGGRKCLCGEMMDIRFSSLEVSFVIRPNHFWCSLGLKIEDPYLECMTCHNLRVCDWPKSWVII